MYRSQEDIVSQTAEPLHVCYLHPLLPKMFYWPKESNPSFTLERGEPAPGWACGVMPVFNVLVLLSNPVSCTCYFLRSWGSCSSLLVPPGAGEWSRWASGYGLWEHWKQSTSRGKAEGIEVQQQIIYIGTSMRKSPRVSLLANSSGNQKRAGEMEGLTFDSWITDRS